MPARIERQVYADTFKLHIWRKWGSNADVLLDDGTWQTVPEMQAIPENAGLTFQMALLDEIFDAFLVYKDYKSHEPTEVKVLREWLAQESKRVDNLIADVSRKALL